jgi:large subunit ribosomal protein L29
MKPAKWRDLSDDEVEQKMRELAEEVFNLRFQLSMGVAKNPSRVREVRRDLARAKTIVHERELERARAADREAAGRGAVAAPAGKRG